MSDYLEERIVLAKKLLISLLCLAAALSLSATGATGAITLEGLVAHLKLDNNLNDELGNVIAPSLGGDATFGPGVYGQALVLDGAGDYANLGPEFGAVMQSLTSFSTSVWVNAARTQHNGPRVWQFGNSDSNQYIALFAFHSVAQGPVGGPRFELKDTDKPDGKANNLKVDAPGDSITENEWTNIVTVLDDQADWMGIYVNGALAVDASDFTRNPSMVDLYDENKIGTTTLSRAKNYLTGSVDDLQIYNRVLSPAEIEMIASGPPPALACKPSEPSPYDGAINVPQEVTLTWKPGAYVEGLSPRHRLFFSENFDDVNDSIGGIEQDVERYPIGEGTLSLDIGQTYYWRVDEANSTSGWDVGDPWQFTVIDHLIVDGFEDYNDSSPNIIYETWVDGWEDPENGSTVGHLLPDILKGEHYVETAIVHGGKQAMPYYYNNTDTATYSEAERTFSPGQDWTREGVGVLSLWFRGYPAGVGSFVEAPAGTYTMTATGVDIWAAADEFHFAYKELSGAGAIIAKVESVQNTDPFAKAGVMIRDTLEPGSRNVALFITPENGVRFQYRTPASSSTDRTFAEGITAPQWVKLERTIGGLFRAFYSADGATWTQVGMMSVSMDVPMYIGLAVTSHNMNVTCEAKFSNVSLTGTTVGSQWIDQDVGMLSNEAEPMYITVGDSNGAAATVYHTNPDATLINTWTQWNVPLLDLSNQGIILTDVGRLAIGFGSADNPQPGGSGLMYFDNIRLSTDMN